MYNIHVACTHVHTHVYTYTNTHVHSVCTHALHVLYYIIPFIILIDMLALHAHNCSHNISDSDYSNILSWYQYFVSYNTKFVHAMFYSSGAAFFVICTSGRDGVGAWQWGGGHQEPHFLISSFFHYLSAPNGAGQPTPPSFSQIFHLCRWDILLQSRHLSFYDRRWSIQIQNLHHYLSWTPLHCHFFSIPDVWNASWYTPV